MVCGRSYSKLGHNKKLHIKYQFYLHSYISDNLMKLINYVKSHKCLVLTQSFKLQIRAVARSENPGGHIVLGGGDVPPPG